MAVYTSPKQWTVTAELIIIGRRLLRPAGWEASLYVSEKQNKNNNILCNKLVNPRTSAVNLCTNSYKHRMVFPSDNDKFICLIDSVFVTVSSNSDSIPDQVKPKVRHPQISWLSSNIKKPVESPPCVVDMGSYQDRKSSGKWQLRRKTFRLKMQ